MADSASASTKTEARIPLEELRRFANDWLLECQLRQHSPQTVYCRTDYLKKLFWFFGQRGYEAVGTSELKQFMLYLARGHEEPDGRWGNRRSKSPMRPVSMHAYYRVLKAMFNWLIEDEAIDFDPMKRVKPPVVRSEVKQPLANEQVAKLLQVAAESKYPRRDEAILLMLMDSGIRAKELCSLQMKDLDLFNRSFRVWGKGNKYRTCYTGRVATKALSKYLRGQKRDPKDPLFVTERDEAFTVSGLYQLVNRLAVSAGIAQCGPHALRRTFAVNFLRASKGDVFACQTLLGHTDLQQTRLYCAVAQADIENQHREFSPVDRLKMKGR